MHMQYICIYARFERQQRRLKALPACLRHLWPKLFFVGGKLNANIFAMQAALLLLSRPKRGGEGRA